MADAFGKPIEEVQEYLDKVSAATAYAAMSVGNNVRIYENEEEYLKAVLNRQLAEKGCRLPPSMILKQAPFTCLQTPQCLMWLRKDFTAT